LKRDHDLGDPLRNMPRTLTHAEARDFYDGFGAKQDGQAFYEDPAVEALVTHASFERARAVVELGCGTGRLAQRLLTESLSPNATYLGVDVSHTMVELSLRRLEPWSARARVIETDGMPKLFVEPASCDRFVSTYVLDLLSESDIEAVLCEAQRILAPGGRLCLASLTHGDSLGTRIVSRLWSALHRLRPQLVGGCRPLALAPFLGAQWHVLHRERVAAYGICTEVIVAEPNAA